MPLPPRNGHTTQVITNVIVHITGELPILVDLEAMPEAGDRSIRCTNVRTIDGKRPAFVHERHSTFILPLSMIRVIELPATGTAASASEPDRAAAAASDAQGEPAEPEDSFEDEEPDEDLLARIRSL